MRQVRFFASFVLVLLPAASAFAQTPRESRPYRGLFGSTKGNAEQIVSVSFNGGGGYDDDVMAGDTVGGSRPPTANAPGSTLGQMSGALSYSLSRSGSRFFAQLGGGASYYPVLLNPWSTSGMAGTGGSFDLSSRTSLTLTAAVSLQSTHYLTALPGIQDPLQPPVIDPEAVLTDPFRPDPFPEPPVSTDPVLGVNDSSYTTFMVSGGLGHALSRKIGSSLHFEYENGQQPTLEDYERQSLGGGLSFLLTKGLSARAGYALTQAGFGQGADTQRLHQLDVGLDFNHALSLTRRTTLELRTGTAALVDEDRTHFYFTANVVLTRELARTWTANVIYDRQVSFLQTFSEPVFSDALSAGVAGLFSRRVQFQSSFGTSFGSVGISAANNGFTNYFTNTSLRVGFTQNLGFTLSYSFYHYRFEEDVELPNGYLPQTDRQSIRAMINLWHTLFQRARRSNASR